MELPASPISTINRKYTENRDLLFFVLYIYSYTILCGINCLLTRDINIFFSLKCPVPCWLGWTANLSFENVTLRKSCRKYLSSYTGAQVPAVVAASGSHHKYQLLILLSVPLSSVQRLVRRGPMWSISQLLICKT